jgi:hypothetical protein
MHREGVEPSQRIRARQFYGLRALPVGDRCENEFARIISEIRRKICYKKQVKADRRTHEDPRKSSFDSQDSILFRLAKVHERINLFRMRGAAFTFALKKIASIVKDR